MTVSFANQEFTWPSLFEQSLEDQFTLAKIEQEINNVTDIEQAKKAALMLAKLAIMRQGVIKALIKQLADLESKEIKSLYKKPI